MFKEITKKDVVAYDVLTTTAAIRELEAAFSDEDFVKILSAVSEMVLTMKNNEDSDLAVEILEKKILPVYEKEAENLAEQFIKNPRLAKAHDVLAEEDV